MMQRCADCLHLRNAAAQVESALPGLWTLSSAYASVRADDGLCTLHDRYLHSTSHCPAYVRSAPASAAGHRSSLRSDDGGRVRVGTLSAEIQLCDHP
jgi:hypothetical protein